MRLCTLNFQQEFTGITSEANIKQKPKVWINDRKSYRYKSVAMFLMVLRCFCRILKLRNLRILDNLKKKWWDENPNTVKCPQQKNEVDGIQLDDMGEQNIIYANIF